MDVQDRIMALDDPSASKGLAALQYIFLAVFIKSFNLDIENFGFAISADVGSAL
tara:strand:+ start:121 stop:282 length:162 start_codon:yes stop_codon:yes gene_type:complete